jgi:hypothetical protein
VPEEAPVAATWYPPYIQLAEQLVEHCFRVAGRVAGAERIHRIAPVVVVVAVLGGIQVQVDPVESQLP